MFKIDAKRAVKQTVERRHQLTLGSILDARSRNFLSLNHRFGIF
jgi:hypothetical protein